MHADLLIHSANQLLTIKNGQFAVIENGAIATKQGRIIAVGHTSELAPIQAAQKIDATNKVITPGLVDCHTHLVFAGSRENEYLMRQNGATYLDILAQGGGILNTVEQVRQAPQSDLVSHGQKWLQKALQYGTTTIEIKSGYGLDFATEHKMLEVINILKTKTKQQIVPTFLGAHTFPLKYRQNQPAYIQELTEQMLPAFQKLAEFCDIFIEKSAFNYQQAEEILKKATALGYKIKLHTNQINQLNGIQLAAKYNATSVDHLDNLAPTEIEQLAATNTIAVLLPGANYFLNENHQAPARTLINNGIKVALATDFNPGSCPTINLQTIMSLAAQQLTMTIEEIWIAVTYHAAQALNREQEIGSLEEGKKAHILIWDMPNYITPLYHFGHNQIEQVIIG